MSFQHNVAGLLKESVGATRRSGIEGRISPAGEPISGEGEFLRTPRGVLVTATLHGALKDTCSRCLKDVENRLDIRIEEEFVQSVDLQTGLRINDADPDDFRIDDHHVLDMQDAVRQYWSAARPMQVLCRADCKGLCPRCGADLNEDAHACAPETDERWDALKQLAGKLEGS
jgi:uncharacterized protein